MSKEVIIIGASGHGKVIADLVERSGDHVLGFLDDDADKKILKQYPVLGRVALVDQYRDRWFFIAIGDNQVRRNIARQYPDLHYYTAIHPDAVIGADVTIGAGTCVMAGAVVNADTKIGTHCILNSGSVVEHDSRLADYVHISPHATLCGTVQVGEASWIGAGAVVKNNCAVGADCILGAGTVAVKNIQESGIYVGVPARRVLP